MTAGAAGVRGWAVRGLLAAVSVAASLVMSSPVAARTWRVPADKPTIQAAVDAAAADDEIRVAPGDHCGATITKPLSLLGQADGAGPARIVGCQGGPTLSPGLRVGFMLPGEAPGAAASGTTISGFHFDGAGISSENLRPLAFGVFARFAHDVTVAGNEFQGTVQAITNTAGDGWSIRSNRIQGLTVFDCTGEHCGGGDGIVVQVASGTEAAAGGASNAFNRPEGTLILGNSIEGRAPPGFSAFAMAGILVLGGEATLIFNNRLEIKAGVEANGESPTRLAAGVLLDDQHAASATPLDPGTKFTGVLLNNALGSDHALVVEGTGGDGLMAAGNFGR